jgi:hypothetical protein
LRLTVALGVACLGVFHHVFTGVARKAIELSGSDLLKIQGALRLDETGYYRVGEAIYSSTGKWLPQTYVHLLRALNLVICVLAMVSLLLGRPA